MHIYKLLIVNVGNNYSQTITMSTKSLRTSLISSPSSATTNHSKANMTAQTSSQETSNSTSNTPVSSATELGYMRLGKATYTLKRPAIQFNYDPSFFILSLIEAGESVIKPLLRSIVFFWSKEDYLTIQNEGSEIGDFPDKLKLTVYGNPDGLSVPDWLSGQPGESSLGVQIEDLSQTADTIIAGQDAWTFSYKSLFEYDGIIFQAANGQMVVITAYKPPSTEASTEAPAEASVLYSAALSTIIESVELVASAFK